MIRLACSVSNSDGSGSGVVQSYSDVTYVVLELCQRRLAQLTSKALTASQPSLLTHLEIP